MAQKTDTPESFADGLKRLIPQVAALLATPDSDPKFVQALLTACAGKLRQPSPAAAGVGGGPGAGPGGPGGPGAPGAGPGSPDVGAGGPAGGAGIGPAGGGQANQQMPNLSGPQGPTPPGISPGLSPTPDELRRMLATNAGG